MKTVKSTVTNISGGVLCDKANCVPQLNSKEIFIRCKIQNFPAKSQLMCDQASFTCPGFRRASSSTAKQQGNIYKVQNTEFRSQITFDVRSSFFHICRFPTGLQFPTFAEQNSET